MPGPDDLRREAARLEERAAELRRMADEQDERNAAALEGGWTQRQDSSLDNRHNRPLNDGMLIRSGGEDRVTGTTPQAGALRINLRPGVKLTSTGPMAVAARNSGHSLFELHRLFEVSYSAIKAWNSRRSAPKEVRDMLAKPPYSVPKSAWKK